jgi:hypothetical protein
MKDGLVDTPLKVTLIATGEHLTSGSGMKHCVRWGEDRVHVPLKVGLRCFCWAIFVTKLLLHIPYLHRVVKVEMTVIVMPGKMAALFDFVVIRIVSISKLQRV